MVRTRFTLLLLALISGAPYTVGSNAVSSRTKNNDIDAGAAQQELSNFEAQQEQMRSPEEKSLIFQDKHDGNTNSLIKPSMRGAHVERDLQLESIFLGGASFVAAVATYLFMFDQVNSPSPSAQPSVAPSSAPTIMEPTSTPSVIPTVIDRVIDTPLYQGGSFILFLLTSLLAFIAFP